MILDAFFFSALFAGVGVALAAGPLGCFVVWRRMAYFGDATAHAAILGVALALAFDGAVSFGVLVSAAGMALAIYMLSGKGLAVDTLLGVAAHSALAFGVLAVIVTGERGVDLEGYLFGDILAVASRDIVLIWGGAALIAALLALRWSKLLTATVSDDLARAEGIRPERERLILMLAVALLVAMAIEVTGALLVTALLVIPAATARTLAATPEAMAILAALLAVGATALGLLAAFAWDMPAGPTIVATSAAGFAVAGLARAAKRIHLG